MVFPLHRHGDKNEDTHFFDTYDGVTIGRCNGFGIFVGDPTINEGVTVEEGNVV